MQRKNGQRRGEIKEETPCLSSFSFFFLSLPSPFIPLLSLSLFLTSQDRPALVNYMPHYTLTFELEKINQL